MPKEHLEDSSSKLCPPCQTVRGTIFASKKKVRLDLHKNYKELSSCKACPLCQFVCRELLYVIDAGVGFKWHDASSFAADQAIAAEVGYTTMVFKHGEVYSTLKIHVGGQKTLEYDKLVIDLDTADREKTFTRPADRFKWAKKWIDRCVEKHSDCGGAMSGSFNPTRLLDVLGDTEESDIRLVLSKNIKGSDHKEGWNDKYMTLSYCWGAPGKNLITTDDNIKERQQTISLNDLPKTVRDAVILTRRMKVRYLWVDALCIIQSNADDWSKEAEVMGQVYRESLCTIAACLGDSCEAGLFSIRDAATLPSPRCLVAEGGSSKMGFILEPKVDQWSCNVERATLNTRGWVLQERILSKRTIFCTREGFFWQCDKKYSSELKDTMDRESGQELVPKLDDLVKAWRAPATEFNFNSTGKVTTKKFTFLQSFFTQPQSRNVEARPWHQLLYDFTRRGLTNQEDRVSAIRGIGTCFATLAKDIYIANGGIWRSDAIGGLAWFRQWDAPSKRLSAAPSWSWASVSGQITSMYKRTGHVVDIATINWDKTIFTSQNPTISISELHIKGPVCRIRIYDPPQYNIYPATDVDAPRPKPIEIPKGKAFGIFNRNFDTKRLSGVISAGGITEHVGWQTGNKYIQKDHYEIVFDAEGEEGRMDQEYLCMPLVSAAFKVPSTQSFAMGVVLVPAGIEGKGNAYKRVGWAFMWRALEDHRIRNTEVIIV